MPNANYQVGVRFERERMKHYAEEGYICSRTAGSHGLFDVYALRSNSVLAIQCKVVANQADADRLLKGFRENPPFKGAIFTQIMEVRVKGSSEVQRVMV